MVNGTTQIKIKKETHKKLKKLQNLYNFKYERDVYFSEIIEELLEMGFKKFDGLKITKEN